MAQVDDFTALLFGSTVGGEIGESVFLTFSFPDQAPDYWIANATAEQIASFEPFTDAEKAMARSAIAELEDQIGITFYEARAGSGDMQLLKFEVDLFQVEEEADAFAQLPAGGSGRLIASDIVFDTEYGANPYLLRHEIGDTLGLKHGREGETVFTPESDVSANTVLSSQYDYQFSGSFGPFDIEALQYLYGDGSNDGTHVDSWSWDAENFVLTQNGGEAGETIIGVGVDDVIDGGGGDDTLAGGLGDDLLLGGAGNDRLLGGVDSDTIEGGDGDDMIVLLPVAGALSFNIDGGSGTDTLIVNANEQFLGDGFSISDAISNGAQLTGIEQIEYRAAEFRPFSIEGSGGAETFFGNEVGVTFDGLGGDDILIAGRGYQEFYGGSGADTFIFGTVASFPRPTSFDEYADQIEDFESGIDMIDLSAIGTVGRRGRSGWRSLPRVWHGCER